MPPARARRGARLRWATTAAVLTGALGAAVPAAAPAAVLPTRVLDQGPDVLGSVSTALADDGTGGAVWLHREDGRAHVYAARFTRGSWAAPVRVDVGQQFASSWPVIAAAEGGRLIVAWVQEYGVASDRLYSAFLSAGASRFDLPAAIDLDVNEATGTQPSLAMSPAGAAIIAYRVIQRERDVDPTLPEGTQGAEYRLARFRGRRWASLGRANRDVTLPVPSPGDGDGPQVAIQQDGNGTVAFLEADANLVQHLWIRRVFAGNAGAAVQVDATGIDGHAPGPVDAFSLSMGPLGDAVVAFRRQAGPDDGALPPSVAVAALPQVVDAAAMKIAGPWPVPGTPVAPPAVSLGDKGGYRVAVPTVDGVFAVPSVKAGVDAGALRSFGAGDLPTSSEGGDGTGAVAWRTASGVGVGQQLRPGVVRTASLAAPGGGPVAELAGAGDGLGDQLLGWRQGDDAAPTIAAAAVDAPPASFLAYGPSDWVRPKHAQITWDAPADALGGLRYAVVLNGVVAADGLTHTGVTLPSDGLDDGRYTVAIRARDGAGQERLSGTAKLKIDGTAPVLTVRRLAGGTVEARIRDGKGSGVNASPTRISFGDGRVSHGATRVRHRYARGKTYTVVASVRDKAGNTDVVRRKVRIR